jgi:L-alanine-DL-glutamate epimerase-like enolase superfamily enzyme
MKIQQIEVIPLRAELPRTFHGSGYAVRARLTVLVRIHTDAGLVGEAYSGDERRAQPELVRIIREELAPVLTGQELTQIEWLWEQMFALSLQARDYRIFMRALSAVDIALWDGLAKLAGLPLYQLLGGYRDSVPVIAIAGYYEDGKTLADLGHEVEDLRIRGLGGIKLKVGGVGVAEDLERLRVTREAGGPNFIIACDANRGWSVADAVAFGRGARPYDVRWLEEPVYWFDDRRGMRAVRLATGLPVTAGESEISEWGCRDLVEGEAIDVMNGDASMIGGVTAWRRVAALCATRGVQLAHHEEPQLALHLLASHTASTWSVSHQPTAIRSGTACLVRRHP